MQINIRIVRDVMYQSAYAFTTSKNCDSNINLLIVALIVYTQCAGKSYMDFGSAGAHFSTILGIDRDDK